MSDAQLALVLSGGGARAAYQVGFLRHLASRHPNLAPGIVTGVSAGGLIAMHLAARSGSFGESVERLWHVWSGLLIDDVFRVDPRDLAARVMRGGLGLVSGGSADSPRTRSLVDTTPLRQLLSRTYSCDEEGRIPGIQPNLDARALDAVALTATSYTTGQSVTWIQSRRGFDVLTWENPQRKSVKGSLRLDHALASSSLPFFFPAVEVDGAWYGDGGIRLTAPLSPAIHLGARKIIAISTRFARSRAEADEPGVQGYPPPAQVAGVLLNAIFLDLLDTDALRLQQVNILLEKLPLDARKGLRHIDLLVMRPSQDLGRLAHAFEPALPRGFRFLVRGLGSREVRSNDMLSLLMFQPDYIARLIALGEADAAARAEEIEAFLST